MQLLLSSYVLSSAELSEAGLPSGGSRRAGIVMNALDQYGSTRGRGFAREARTLEACGYRCTELDLRTYFGTGEPATTSRPSATSRSFTAFPAFPASAPLPASAPDRLAERLSRLDLVWVLGGNSFVLARAMYAAGFGAALRQQEGRAEFVYGGYSAGACVAGPDLRGIDLMDDPKDVAEGYPPAAAATGLHLVPFRIVPHWRSAHPEAAAAERAAAWLQAAGLPYRCLRDGQVVTADGTVRTLSGPVLDGEGQDGPGSGSVRNP